MSVELRDTSKRISSFFCMDENTNALESSTYGDLEEYVTRKEWSECQI